jgi:hypothetical protein
MVARACADLLIIPDRREGREAPLELLAGFGEEQKEDHGRVPPFAQQLCNCQRCTHEYDLWHPRRKP